MHLKKKNCTVTTRGGRHGLCRRTAIYYGEQAVGNVWDMQREQPTGWAGTSSRQMAGSTHTRKHQVGQAEAHRTRA